MFQSNRIDISPAIFMASSFFVLIDFQCYNSHFTVLGEIISANDNKHRQRSNNFFYFFAISLENPLINIAMVKLQASISLTINGFPLSVPSFANVYAWLLTFSLPLDVVFSYLPVFALQSRFNSKLQNHRESGVPPGRFTMKRMYC